MVSGERVYFFEKDGVQFTWSEEEEQFVPYGFEAEAVRSVT